MVETGFNNTVIGKVILAACFINDIAQGRPQSGAIGESATFILSLPEKLFEKAPRGHLDKGLRLPVCQDNHACSR
jgi:hypothetical protein